MDRGNGWGCKSWPKRTLPITKQFTYRSPFEMLDLAKESGVEA